MTNKMLLLLRLWFIVYILTTMAFLLESKLVKPVTNPNPISIYDALESHGLPIGLLPKGVKGFVLEEDGRFEAHLDQVCRSKLDNQFEYKKDISGRLSYGRVANLTGMESLELFVWVSVNGIRVDIPNSGRIHFDLEKGVHKELSVSLFETPADCVAVSGPTSVDFDHLLTTTETDMDMEMEMEMEMEVEGVVGNRRLGQRRSRKDVM